MSETLYKYLADIGRSGSPEDFKKSLLKFGHDPDALKALEKGMAAAHRYEDSGSYCENASPGYYILIKREAVLKDFYLGNGDFAGAKSRGTAESLDTLEDLRQQMREMTERMQVLEEKLASMSRENKTYPQTIRLHRPSR